MRAQPLPVEERPAPVRGRRARHQAGREADPRARPRAEERLGNGERSEQEERLRRHPASPPAAAAGSKPRSRSVWRMWAKDQKR
jgi:hypothetical protein